MLFDFQLLEKKYPVEDIKVNGIQVWPMLRTYIVSQIVFDQDRSVKMNSSILKGILKYFFRGFSNIFKKTDYIFFTNSGQRRIIDGKFIDTADVLASLLKNTLIVELPFNGQHLDKIMYPSGNLISKYPFYFLTLFLSKIRRKYKIENEEFIKKIMEETGIHIPYHKRIKLFMAERSLMKFIIKWKKLKAFFLITPYTNMGYVYAFKEMKLPVIEFQHGTISKSHYAYNIIKSFDRKLFPDYLLSYGQKEKDVFTKENFYIDEENVLPVGSLIIDSMMKRKPKDQSFEKLTERYNKVVAFSAQDALENQYTSFLKKAAELDKSICYILIPRFKDLKYYERFDFPENVKFLPWLTTYELLYLCHVHSTINSTTAIEAPSLGTMNILINVENRSKDYFSHILDDRVCLYANTPLEYVNSIKTLVLLSKDEVAAINTGIIKKGFVDNLRISLDKILA